MEQCHRQRVVEAVVGEHRLRGAGRSVGEEGMSMRYDSLPSIHAARDGTNRMQCTSCCMPPRPLACWGGHRTLVVNCTSMDEPMK